ncbi:MAG: GGDEF domain-containing protein, partial [Chromatiaceae bacterium]
MNQTPDPTGHAVADAEDELARLGVQVDAMRALLVRLTQDAVRAGRCLGQSRPPGLVEVNEQLVLAALTSQADAEVAAQALQDAVQSAELDALTQLANRTTLLGRFAQVLANARRHGVWFALLFLDLDKFKQFNDAYGHAFGDRVLKLVADRLVSAVRREDTVSRYGGDEFLVLLAELNRPEDARTVAEKLSEALGAPAELDGHVVGLSACVGIAIYPEDGDDFDTLVARADAAMYEAKRQRAGGVAFRGKAPRDGPGLEAQPSAAMHQPG